VNNFEVGFISHLEINIDIEKNRMKTEEKESLDHLTIQNIFGKVVNVSFKTIESINFDYNSALIQTKSATSLFSRLGYKILKKYKPERIIIT